MKFTDEIFSKLTRDMMFDIFKQQAEKVQTYFIIQEELVTEVEDKETFENFLENAIKDIKNLGNTAKNQLKAIINQYSNILDERCNQGDRVKELEDVVSKLLALGITTPKPNTSQASAKDPTAEAIVLSLAHSQNKQLKVPWFSGAKNESIDDWLFVVDSIIESSSIDPNRVVRLITQFLKGSALHALQRFQSEHYMNRFNWDRFRRYLIERFHERDLMRKLRVELNSLTMKDGFSKFVENFERISGKIEDMSDRELLFIFTEALPSKMKLEVLS